MEYPEPVGKRIELSNGSDELIRSKRLEARSGAGKLINVEFASAAKAFAYRLSSDARRMFFSGTFARDFVDAVVVPHGCRQESREVFEIDQAPVILSATKEYLEFREGAGLLSIDIDFKRSEEVKAIWPAAPVPLGTSSDVLQALHLILPESSNAPTAVVASSSSMITRDPDNLVMSGPGGWRVLIAIDDAREIPAVLRLIHDRCWSEERYCYAFVSAGGQILFRSLADLALARPTQPDYPAADLGPGLRRALDAACIVNVDGDLLNSAALKNAPLDRAAALRNRQMAKSQLDILAGRVRTSRKEMDVRDHVARGVPRQAAVRAADRKFDAGILLGPEMIVFVDERIVSVADLIQNGSSYDGSNCHDPIEPDYDGGRVVGRFYWNDGKGAGIYSFAHGGRFYRLRHDERSAEAALGALGEDENGAAKLLALTDINPVAYARLEAMAAKQLRQGSLRKPLRELVDKWRQEVGSVERADNLDLEGELPRPLHAPLNPRRFPKAIMGRATDDRDNVAFILSGYGFTYRYNVVLKAFEWDQPDLVTSGDHTSVALHSVLIGQCELNEVPTKNLGIHLTGLANDNAYNPVRDFLAALKWDGISRLDDLARAMEPNDLVVALLALRYFFIQACAAADHAETGRRIHLTYRAHFEGVLVFVGAQGIGKTKGLRNLLPPKLRDQYMKEGLVLDLSSKDSRKAAVSSWVVELGELDSTFKRSDIASLKAFLSQDTDEIREPYAPKASQYARRTVFAGTVNDDSFLADETGNRRFWPITASRLDVGWSDAEIDQVWAEAWSLYVAGEKWWPSADEEALFAANAERYRIKTALEEAVERTFDWGKPPDRSDKRMTVSEIYQMLNGPSLRPLDIAGQKTIASALKRLWLKSGLAKTSHGVLLVKGPGGDWIRVLAEGGRNRGWLLPPHKGHAPAVNSEVVLRSLKGRGDGVLRPPVTHN